MMERNPIPHFHFSQLPQLIFGIGKINNLAELCSNFGKHILLVTGGASYQLSAYRSKLEKQLREKQVKWTRYSISKEPSPADIDEAVSAFRNSQIDVVVALGGGSVLDAGKAIAAMFCEDEGITQYLEGVGDKKPGGKRLPLIAVPTTAGTGSESTKNAVITRQGKDGFKKSLRHNNYVPDIALIDPELTVSCSPQQTAASGMDAFTQLLEAYLSVQANPITDALAYSGLEQIALFLERSVKDGSDLEARSGMAYAAMLSGVCLANVGLGLIHGFAQPLGSLFPIPHGVVCGSLMHAVNKHTVEHLRKQDSQSTALQKYARVGSLFAKGQNLNQDAQIDALLYEISNYIRIFKLPRFSDFGVTESDVDSIVELTGLKNHPLPLSRESMANILRERL